jgi:hypothetical protein
MARRVSSRRYIDSVAIGGEADIRILFGLQTHCTATGVQPPQNADHSFAGYTYINRQALEGARCSPRSLGERGRKAPQQTDRPQRESSSENRWLDESGREAPQQTGGSCGTSSSHEPSKASPSPCGHLKHLQNTRLVTSPRRRPIPATKSRQASPRAWHGTDDLYSAFLTAVGYVIDLATRNKDADFHERLASGALRRMGLKA